MKVGTSRFFVVAAIAILAVMGAGVTPALAQSPAFSSFTSTTNLALNGNAALFPATSPTVLRLTPALSNQTGSTWFNVQQPVKNGFTTTFTFQITGGAGSPTSGDGIAFVIQNAGTPLTAIGYTGGSGGALGYGDSDGSTDPSAGQGIADSIAIEFDTYDNEPWDATSHNHIAIQSCGQGRNTSHHHFSCQATGGGDSTLGFLALESPSFADGTSHTVTITYTPPSTGSGPGSLVVTVGDHSLSASVNLDTLLALNDGNAYVGFTAATGASVENHDITSWTYQAQVQAGETTVFQFNNNNYLVTPDADQETRDVQVTPVFKTPAACNALVQANALAFVDGALKAQCFEYKDAGGPGVNSSVMYEVICTDSTSTECNPFNAELGTTYDLPTTVGSNPGFNPGNPLPGWLKGDGGAVGHPCTPPSSGFLFASNQVSSFELDASDPVTKGKSGGTASCWVATYNTPHEAPGVTITTPGNVNYQQFAPVNAAYACQIVNAGSGSPTGPYLTQTSCGATNTYGVTTVNVNPGNPIDTSTPGPHTFIANVVDSATDNASQTVTYNVVTPADLAILKVAPLLVRAGATITYAIGVGNLGGSNAVDVVVSDILPADTTLVGTASGNNVSCAIVNKKLTCTTTAMICTGGSTVSCASQTPIAPLSLSSLNGATVKLTVKLGSTWTAGKVVKNTASVTSTNADPKPNNNKSTASTLVTR